jgi:hypothetical protein
LSGYPLGYKRGMNLPHRPDWDDLDASVMTRVITQLAALIEREVRALKITESVIKDKHPGITFIRGPR